VIRELALRVAEAWALAAALQLALWLVQQRTRNAGIVDVGWAASFALVAGLFASRSAAPIEAWGPIAAIVVAWSVRLTAYLVARGAAKRPEEGRYAELRARWGANASRNFFVFFQAQAALTGILSMAFVVPFVAAPGGSGWPRALGAALAIAGIAGETIADAQLARFRRDPAHRGRVCDAGLWAWSRHPNYFFEWCVWLGHALYGLAFWDGGGWIALFPQALLLASILFVTGIPPTEAQALRSKGDAYRAYQRRVSRFVPLPPRTPRGASRRG
jgi:steroid 5-alpha reductase family enzyme